MKPLRRITALFILLSVCHSAAAIDVSRPEVQSFIDNMVEEFDYDRSIVENAIAEAKTQQKILDAISRPAERSLNWTEYRAIFMTDERIEAGARFWEENKQDIDRISMETGVSPEILVGIIGVETYFGRITGNYRVLDALTTLAFDYPPRATFFSRELREFLLLVREEQIDAAEPTGSYAGAMGRPQFMPSSFRAYAVDASDDGQRDIWDNWQDVLGSVANYFLRHGWQGGNEVAARATLGTRWQSELPKNTLKPTNTVASLSQQGVEFPTGMPGEHTAQLVTLDTDEGKEYWVGMHNFFVITRYNRSVMYALAVHQLGQAIAVEVEGAKR